MIVEPTQPQGFFILPILSNIIQFLSAEKAVIILRKDGNLIHWWEPAYDNSLRPPTAIV
jgi:hypothetical protein